MRWLRARDPGTCAGCDAVLERGAQWCGRCGARVAAAPATEDAAGAAAPTAAPAQRAPGGGRARLLGVVALVGVLVAALVAGVTREPAPVPLLGTAAGAGGQTASGPPPQGLRLAWSVPVVDDGGRTVVVDPRLVVRDGRLAIDDRVADLATGRLVGTVPGVSAIGGDGVGVAVSDDGLVLLDVLEGTVLRVTPLPSFDTASTGVPVRVGDVTVVVDHRARQTALVRDDGTVLARHDGAVEREYDRALGVPAAVNVRDGVGPDAPSKLVSTRDGSVVAEVGADGPQVVDVVGDRALVAAATTDDLGAPGTGVVWDLRLLDARRGGQLARARLVSAVAPRLLGTFADGTVAVATRSGQEVAIWRLDDEVEAVTQVRRNVLRGAGSGVDDALLAGASAMLRRLAMVDGVVVVHDASTERVAAIGGDGRQRWSRPATGPVAVAAAGGLVALVPDEGRTRVLDAADGTEVTTVPPLDRSGAPVAPVALLSDDLALAPPSPVGLDVSVGTVRWVDLASGEQRTAEEVFDGVAPPDEVPSGNWRLVGVVRDDTTGQATPVVLRDLGRDVVQLLEVGSGFRTIDLDLPDEGDVASFLARVVGATDAHVALWTDSFEGVAASVTHLVDRRTGSTRHLRGLVGLALRDGLVLALDPAADELVALDPGTGDEQWRSAVPGSFFDGAIDDELLVATAATTAAATLLEDGSPAWRHEASTALTGRVVLGTSLLALPTVAGEVVALDRSDGAERWRAPLGVPATALAAAGDDVLVGTADGLVVHLDERGREVQRIAVGAGPVRHVAALGGTVVAVVGDAAVGLRADGGGVARRDEVELP